MQSGRNFKFDPSGWRLCLLRASDASDTPPTGVDKRWCKRGWHGRIMYVVTDALVYPLCPHPVQSRCGRRQTRVAKCHQARLLTQYLLPTTYEVGIIQEKEQENIKEHE